jgi:hypothetical protein
MKSKAFLLLAAAFTLTGCAYRDINPEAATADMRAHNGYEELRSVEPGSAKLVLRARGSGYPAHFSVSTSPHACQDFSSLGRVAYDGRAIVYPWIANAVQGSRRAISKAEPYRVHEAKPGEPIQVRGYGSWSDGTGSGYRSGHCGPVVARFTPREGHAYTVEYVWGSKPACSLVVMDATNPDAPVAIDTEDVAGCAPPM